MPFEGDATSRRTSFRVIADPLLAQDDALAQGLGMLDEASMPAGLREKEVAEASSILPLMSSSRCRPGSPR